MTNECQHWVETCLSEYSDIRGRVLEIGSYDENGNPRHHFAAPRFGEYVGVDMRPGPCVDYVMDSNDLHFPGESFDVVVDMERMEHDRTPWRSMHEAARILRSGGHIIITTRSCGMPQHNYPSDYYRFLAEGLAALMEDAGFQVLKTQYDEPTTFSYAGQTWSGHRAIFALGRKPRPTL